MEVNRTKITKNYARLFSVRIRSCHRKSPLPGQRIVGNACLRAGFLSVLHGKSPVHRNRRIILHHIGFRKHSCQQLDRVVGEEMPMQIVYSIPQDVTFFRCVNRSINCPRVKWWKNSVAKTMSKRSRWNSSEKYLMLYTWSICRTQCAHGHTQWCLD